jgi:hypothetical protein
VEEVFAVFRFVGYEGGRGFGEANLAHFCAEEEAESLFEGAVEAFGLVWWRCVEKVRRVSSFLGIVVQRCFARFWLDEA